MSDTSQGSGWWLASDGKWYPPELWTGPPDQAPAVTATPGTPAVTPAEAGPTWPPVGPGTAPPTALPYGSPEPNGTYGVPALGAYGTPGSAPYGTSAPTGPPGFGGYPPNPYAYGGVPVQAKRNNGLAIAALVCGICGFLWFIPAVLGVVFGFVARSQIRQSGGAQGGNGLALAGIILGFAWIALLLVIIVAAASTTSSNGVVAVAPHLLRVALHS